MSKQEQQENTLNEHKKDNINSNGNKPQEEEEEKEKYQHFHHYNHLVHTELFDQKMSIENNF